VKARQLFGRRPALLERKTRGTEDEDEVAARPGESESLPPATTRAHRRRVGIDRGCEPRADCGHDLDRTTTGADAR
jgi:hypothetical protein